MAATDYPQIDEEEYRKATYGDRASKITHFNEPDQQSASQTQEAVKPPTRPANTSSVPNAAAPPSRSGDIDLTGMVNQVTNATTQMQQDMPAPKPADSVQHIMDLVAKHWQIPAAIVGAGATAAILNNLMKGGDGTRPPPNPGGLANPVEPSMDVNKQGPREPYLPEEKPTIQSRNFTPKYSAEEQAWIAKSEANRIAKEQDAARRAQAEPTTPKQEPPAFILNKSASADVPPNEPKKIWEPPTAESMRAQYNRGVKNPIGPSAFNHLANNLGLEKAKEVWEGMYGKTNVPYDQYIKDYSQAAGKEMVGPKQPLAPGAKPGGSFGTPKYIPEYIKGSVDPRLLGGVAGTALAGYLAKPSIEAAAQAAGQGDTELAKAHASELLNIHPLTALGNILFGKSPQEVEMIRKEKSDQILKQVSDLLKEKTIGAGRGVTPSSAYKR